jgi:hypothetical protein
MRVVALALVACAALAGASLQQRAQAQQTAPVSSALSTSSAQACPQAADVTRQHLFGLWRAEFEGGKPTGATLLLEPHPELALSLSGAINRNGERAQLAGDIEDGEFSLEESADGIRIDAVWMGDVVEGSCGREIRGAWKAEGGPRQFQFVLKKQ